MKATYGSIEVKGGIAEEDSETLESFGKAMLTACPDCGRAARLPIPPFTFTREPLSIGPASVIFPCGWHGYLTNGIWQRSPDSRCGQPGQTREGRKVARTDLKIGDHVSFLRMSNKAVRMTGTIVAFNEDGKTVDIALDHHDVDSIENAHLDDVTVLEPAPAEEVKQ
jgi:hypothetical protein